MLISKLTISRLLACILQSWQLLRELKKGTPASPIRCKLASMAADGVKGQRGTWKLMPMLMVGRRQKDAVTISHAARRSTGTSM